MACKLKYFHFFYFAGKVSLTISGLFNLPKTNSQEDVDAAERANQFEVSQQYDTFVSDCNRTSKTSARKKSES